MISSLLQNAKQLSAYSGAVFFWTFSETRARSFFNSKLSMIIACFSLMNSNLKECAPKFREHRARTLLNSKLSMIRQETPRAVHWWIRIRKIARPSFRERAKCVLKMAWPNVLHFVVCPNEWQRMSVGREIKAYEYACSSSTALTTDALFVIEYSLPWNSSLNRSIQQICPVERSFIVGGPLLTQ